MELAQELVPSREFTEWGILEQLDPWGQARADWYVAVLRADLHNMFRDAKRHRQPFKAEQFLPEWSWEEGLAMQVDPQQHVVDELVAAEEQELRDAHVARLNTLFTALGGVEDKRKDN